MIRIEKKLKSETRSNLELKLESRNLGIKVEGWDKEHTEFDIKLEYESDSGSEIILEDVIKTNYESDANLLTIEIENVEHVKTLKADLRLLVPKLTETEGNLENGPIRISGLEGTQKISSENGLIKLQDCRGELHLQNENGSLKINDHVGDITASTENGAFVIKNCQGIFKITTENGVVKSYNSAGKLDLIGENNVVKVLDSKFDQVDIKSENGSIYYEFAEISAGSFKFSNINGRIQLIIPDKIPVSLEAVNGNGRINIGVKGEYERSSEHGKAKVIMMRGNGNVKIRAENEQGSINISDTAMKTRKTFKFSGISDMINNIMDSIPEQELEKADESIERVKMKIKSIDFKGIEQKVQAAMNKVDEAISSEFTSDKNREILAKVKIKVDKALGGIQETFRKTEDQNEKEEQSRLKILKMVEEGKITVDEAEKLLAALGIKK